MRIVNFMKVKSMQGITGEVVLGEEGRRSQFHLEVIELLKDGYKKIATWSANDGAGSLNYTRTTSEVEMQIVESLQNKTFVVSVKLGAPFLLNR
jgi:glutamate receptor, ionotropic, invertebrate